MSYYLMETFLNPIFYFFRKDEPVDESFEALQKMYEKNYPRLKKQKLEESLRPVICDGSIEDSYFSTNIYPYIGYSKEMNWGYSGAGPQLLALNILFLFTAGDGVFARKHYLDFMQDFLLSKKQNEDLETSVSDISSWIHKRNNKPAKILKLVSKGGELV